MKIMKKRLDRDFFRSEIMTNAFDTSAEFHKALSPGRPNHRDFHKRNYKKLDEILEQNKRLYTRIIQYKSEYSKDRV